MDVHLFPGQGSQYSGMTSGLQRDPWISEMIDRAEAWSSQLLGCRFGDHLRSGTSPEHDVVQSFLCDQLRILLGSLSIHHKLSLRGVTARWRIGHSLGEISALTAAGWLDVDTALRIVCLRSKAIVESAPPGGMTAVLASTASVQQLLGSCQDLFLSLSTFNSPSQSTVSGPTGDLDRFEKYLTDRGLAYKRLHAKYPFHGPLMAEAAKAFSHSIAEEKTHHGSPVWSAIYNRPYTAYDPLCRLLASHLVLPVLFFQSLSKFAYAGVDNYVEIGGRKALVGLTRDLLKALGVSLPKFITTSLPGGESEDSQVGHAADTLASTLRYHAPGGIPSHTHPLSAPMIQLSSCSNDQLQSLIIAATGELSRRAQAMGSFQSMQTTPMAWSHPGPTMSQPMAPMGWMPAGPASPPQPLAAPPPPQPVLQDPVRWPSSLPSHEGNPIPHPMLSGNSHGPGAEPPEAKAEPVPVGSPLTMEPLSISGLATASASAPAPQALNSQPVAAATPSPPPSAAAPTVDHGDALLNQLILIYQEATEYPAEILEPDANLEADLGIDSVKQMQVLGLVRERFSFELPEDTDMKSMRTIREVADAIRPLATLG
jgi:malonyl CoA-acyl carrier protein transacylase